MSIEKQLTEEFKRNESSLQCSPSLDTRIIAEYGRMVMDKRSNIVMVKKRNTPKVVIIALVVAVLCGFAYGGTKFLFSDSQSNFSIRMQTNEAVSFNSDTLENIRTSLKDVQAQLAPGETAVVYHPEIFLELPGVPPLIGVTSLQLIPDSQQWKSVLEEKGVTELLPDSLLAGAYQFVAGTINSPFHSMMGLDALDLLDEMKTEQKNRNEDQPMWRLTDITDDHPVSLYTSVYRDANGEALYLTWEIFNDSSMKIESFTSPSTEYAEIDLNGQKVHYTKNNQSLFGESNVLQSVMWIEEKDSRTIVYYVESDSVNMTKERLIEVVKSLS